MQGRGSVCVHAGRFPVCTLSFFAAPLYHSLIRSHGSTNVFIATAVCRCIQHDPLPADNSSITSVTHPYSMWGRGRNAVKKQEGKGLTETAMKR